MDKTIIEKKRYPISPFNEIPEGCFFLSGDKIFVKTKQGIMGKIHFNKDSVDVMNINAINVENGSGNYFFSEQHVCPVKKIIIKME